MRAAWRHLLAGGLAAAVGWACAAVVPLPALTLEPGQASVSGLSSGGYMAGQLHVAHAATFAKGAGIVAAGPWGCSEGNVLLALGRCMKHSTAIDTGALAEATRRAAAAGAVDPLAAVAASKVYVFGGQQDKTVAPAVVQATADFYARLGAGVTKASRDDAAHAMLTMDDGPQCPAVDKAYFSDCDVDLAGEILRTLYGPLAPRNGGAPQGEWIEFDQTAFARGHGLAASGFVYVPAACRGGPCRLHVALHGCHQNAAAVGRAFVERSGYHRWADTNRLVVLYPQTGDGATNGCWDWWGYAAPAFATKAAPQVAAVHAMAQRLAGGALPPKPAAPVCVSASNVAHVAAGRGTVAWGAVFAAGSAQPMGWWTWFSRTALQQSAPSHWLVVERC